MKKITLNAVIISGLVIAALSPFAASAATTGFGGDLPCIAWTTDMPVGVATWNGQGVCRGADDTNKRLYNLESSIDALKAQNATLQAEVSQLSANPAPTASVAPQAPQSDYALTQRVTVLEGKVATDESDIALIKTTFMGVLENIVTYLKTKGI